METKQKNLKLFAIIQNYCESFFNFVNTCNNYDNSYQT